MPRLPARPILALRAPGLAAGGFGGGGGASGGGRSFGRAGENQQNSPAGGAQEDSAATQGGRKMAKTVPRASQSSGERGGFGFNRGRSGAAADGVDAQTKANALDGAAPSVQAGIAGPNGVVQRSASIPANVYQNNALFYAQRPNVYRMQNGAAYDGFVRQNGLVSLDTKGQKMPVSQALQQLGQQANVLILLDPSVPSDEKFTIRAAIPPRSFQDVLTLLASYAQLNWRYLGNQSNRILVTPAPEFQLFWGESNTPRVSTPNAEKREKRE